MGQGVQGADPVVEAGEQTPGPDKTIHPAAEVIDRGVDQGDNQHFLLILHPLDQFRSQIGQDMGFAAAWHSRDAQPDGAGGLQQRLNNFLLGGTGHKGWLGHNT